MELNPLLKPFPYNRKGKSKQNNKEIRQLKPGRLIRTLKPDASSGKLYFLYHLHSMNLYEKTSREKYNEINQSL